MKIKKRKDMEKFKKFITTKNILLAVVTLCFGLAGLFILISRAAGPNASYAPPTIYFSDPNGTLATEQTFTIEIRANSGETSINAVNAEFTYPSNLVEFVSFDNTGSAFGIQPESNSNVPGVITMARAQIGGVTGDVLVGKVTFKTKTATGDVHFAFTDSTVLLDSANSSNILPSLEAAHGASYTIPAPVSNPDPEPEPEPDPAPDPTPDPTPPPTNQNPSPAPSGSPAAPAVYLYPFTKTLQPNETFTMEVRANSGTTNVNAVNAEFTYPANLVDFVSLDYAGGAYGTQIFSVNKDSKVTIVRAQIGGLTGDQLVGKVTFKAKAGAGGTAAFNFSNEVALTESTNAANLINSAALAYGASYQVASSPLAPQQPNNTPNNNAPPNDENDKLNDNTDTGDGNNNSNRNSDEIGGSVDDSNSVSGSSDETSTNDENYENEGESNTDGQITALILIKDTNGKIVKNTKIFINGKEYKTDDKGYVRYTGNAGAKLRVSVKDKNGREKELGSITLVKGAVDQKFVASSTLPQSGLSPIVPVVSITVVLVLLAGGVFGIGKIRRMHNYNVAHGLVATHNPTIGSSDPDINNHVNQQPITVITPTETVEEDINEAAKKIVDSERPQQ